MVGLCKETESVAIGQYTNYMETHSIHRESGDYTEVTDLTVIHVDVYTAASSEEHKYESLVHRSGSHGHAGDEVRGVSVSPGCILAICLISLVLLATAGTGGWLIRGMYHSLEQLC